MFFKVVLVWFQGRGCSYKGATPNVATDSKSLILELSNELSFVSEFQLKQGQNIENVFLKISYVVYYVQECKYTYTG